MFEDPEFEEFLSRHGVSDAGKAYVRRVRTSEPSRAVGSGQNNVTCRFASRKMGRTIQAESHTGELPAIWHWEFDARTYEFWDQPEATLLPIIRKDGRKTNQPKRADFLILQEDFVGWVECKHRDWLENEVENGNQNFFKDEDGGWHYRPGEEVAAAWGLQYAIRLAEDNNPVLVDNFSFLDDYLRSDTPPIGEQHVERIRACFKDRSWILLQTLIGADPALTADHIYTAIAQRKIYAELSQDRLSEPFRTYVFLDRVSAESYRIYLKTENRSGLDISTVSLTPSSTICWDNNVWTIVNAGQTEYCLSNEQNRLTSISREAMCTLISEGKVHADPAAPTARSERVVERLRLASPDQRRRAVIKYRALFPEEGSPPVCVPSRTLTEWRRAFRRGVEVYGNGFVGLLPNIHRRGNRDRKLPSLTFEIIANVAKTRYLTAEARNKKAAYGIVRAQCKAAGVSIPSESTFLRELKRNLSILEEVGARHGRKAAYQIGAWYWRLDDDTPAHGQYPFEIGHLDHTEIDLQLIDQNHCRKTRKCWATALIDAYSRVVLAIILTFDPPSYRSCMQVIQECVKRHGRVPSTLVVDWGSDFRSEWFEQLLAFLDVHKKHRPKSSPRHGTLIERLFKRMNEDVIHQMRGNNKALQKPRGMSKTHDPRERAVWTLGRFREVFEAYIYDTYEQQPHETLGVTPRHAFQAGMCNFGDRMHVRISFDEAFRMVCLPSTSSGLARISEAGFIKLNSILYQATELKTSDLVGQDVAVRYDPFNMGRAFAFIRNRWILLTSKYANVFCRYSEREIENASAQIREANRATYANRQISVDVLAKFLLRMEGEEMSLLAIQKAMVAGKSTTKPDKKSDIESASPDDPPRSSEESDTTSSDLFANLPIEHYGAIE